MADSKISIDPKQFMRVRVTLPRMFSLRLAAFATLLRIIAPVCPVDVTFDVERI